MHSVLFVATIPENRHDFAEFQMFSEPKLRQAKGVLQLAENVWLLNLKEATEPLGWLMAYASQKAISYGLLPFERKPEWLPDGFYPKTIQDQTA
jgi:hypothetical protein